MNAANAAAGEPIESILKIGVANLFSSLPAALQHERCELPRVVDCLEAHARALRARLAALNLAISALDASGSRPESPRIGDKVLDVATSHPRGESEQSAHCVGVV